MSYATRVDEMVGEHVKHFQDEMTMAKLMEKYVPKTVPMPYGYPIAVYYPRHVCRSPEVKKFVARTGGRLSNGVPRVIGMEIVNQYALGLYNPARS
jgi:hypothetical protein